MTPKVSVITPIYNVAKFLPQCLDSLLAQTLKEIEFICVNDGSTDNSLEILESYAARDSRIVIIDKPNGGYGHTMNRGIEKARGEYIGIVESDDYVDPDAFETLYSLAESNDFCDIVKGNHNIVSTGHDPVFVENYPPEMCGRVMSPLDCDGSKVINSIPAIWAAIYRRQFLIDNDITFLETPGASYQDTGFVCKSWIAADTFYLTHDAFLNYRVDNTGSSVNSPSKLYCVFDEFHSIEEYLEKRPERRKILAGPVNAKKFDVYMWNIERIPWELLEEYFVRVAEDFDEASKRGDLVQSAFSKKDYKTLKAILDDPHQAYKKLKLESDLKWKAALPTRLSESVKRRVRVKLGKDPDYVVLAKERAEKALVSIIVPVFNAEMYLDDLFESLLKQTHRNLEIICIDDGSTDRSASIIKAFAEKDDRVRLISIKNSGPSAARNIGISESKGDYICFVDADDILAKAALGKIIVTAEVDADDVVVFGIDEFDDQTKKRFKMPHAIVKGKIPFGQVFRPRDIDNFFVNMVGFTVNKLYRADYLKSLDLAFPNIGAHEDMPFTCTATVAAKRATCLESVLYHYRRNREGSRSDKTNEQYKLMLEALECLRNELTRLDLFNDCERNFVNYVAHMCRWKFSVLSGKQREDFFNYLNNGWLEKIGATGFPDDYFFNDWDRKFMRSILSKSYAELLEIENRNLAASLDDIQASRAYRLGNVIAAPIRAISGLAAKR